MAATSGFSRIALMCHAPIVIPEIAGPRGVHCSSTTAAMRRAAAWIIEDSPETIVIASPHSPRHDTAFGVLTGDVAGDFSRFGWPQLTMCLDTDRDWVDALVAANDVADVELKRLASFPLDHGAAVPLWFLCEAGYTGRLVVMALPWQPKLDNCVALGRRLAAVAGALGTRTSLIASGDMSHCLTTDAPADFHPDGPRFDEAVSSCVADGNLDDALAEGAALRKNAAEDVIDTLSIARGAIDGLSTSRSLSYEGPFGVGYLVAELYP